MKTLIVIPARLGSWRFPDKPLTLIEGLPMIEHVYRRSCLVNEVTDVVMAVCEDKVARACRKFGARVVMTSNEHQTAIDRVAEAAEILGYTSPDDIVVNVQGDEPVVPPPVIERTIELAAQNADVHCANLVEEIGNPSELVNHHRIKAVISRNQRLIYLTRQAIPASVFDVDKQAVFYRQTCVIAFRGDFLQAFANLPRTPLELVEGIDMLRLIENDYPVASGVSPHATYPVDTPEDLPQVVSVLQTDPWFANKYR